MYFFYFYFYIYNINFYDFFEENYENIVLLVPHLFPLHLILENYNCVHFLMNLFLFVDYKNTVKPAKGEFF